MVTHYTIQGQFPGKKLRKEEKEKVLYHYTSFNNFKSIWKSKTFRLGDVKRVNDIYEQMHARSVRSRAWDKDNVMEEYLKIRGDFKQASFTMDYDSYIKGCQSPTMWAHYGDETKRDENGVDENGVCIEINPTKIKYPAKCFKGPVSYVKRIPLPPTIYNSVTDENGIYRFIEKKQKKLFFTKHADWKYENEYRIVSNMCDEIDISDAINCVYVTHCPSKTCKLLQELIGDAIPIKLIDFIKSNKYQIPVITDVKEAQRRLKERCNWWEESKTKQNKLC